MIPINVIPSDIKKMDSFTIFMPDKSENAGYFTNFRVERNTLPQGWFAYDLREGDSGKFCTLEPHVLVNHGGTFLTQTEIDFGESDYINLSGRKGCGDYSF